jgi:uncharacterized protein (DUF1800 family)
MFKLPEQCLRAFFYRACLAWIGISTAQAQSTDLIFANGLEATVNLSLAPTRPQAVRFLTQASFGAKRSDVDALVLTTIPQWLDQQFAKPIRSHATIIADLTNRFYDGNYSRGPLANVESVFRQAAYGEDQLRQRAAWALSQIFVIGESTTPRDADPGRFYLDILNRGAFGNYRQLLEEVSLSTSMGLYLSHIGNEKEDLATGRLPDENYAREIMQLFTIGLWQLNPDGTRRLDTQGQPIPSYGQNDIRGLAKVFTGFTYSRCLTDPNPSVCVYGSRLGWGPEPTMVAFQMFHSTSEKRFLGTVLAPGRPAMDDLRDALDVLFNHPNTAPFVSRQLIQRLVTSNPSPQYVQRVAAKFINNGSGVRGDMKAVWRAILQDDEARDPRFMTDPNFGKLREPVVRWLQFLRVFTLPNTDGRAYYDFNRMTPAFAQWPMGSPSIFNFYRPTFAPPGLRSAGLAAPEFQITNEFTIAATHNEFHLWSSFNSTGGGGEHRDDYAWLVALGNNPAAMVDALDLLLTYQTLNPSVRTEMIAAISRVPSFLGNLGRAKLALKLFFSSPDYLIQK